MNHRQKESIKIFIFLFIGSYIITNWNNVSWIFNYKEVNGLVYDFFNPYQDSSLLAETQDPALNNANYQSSGNDSLSIPQIGLFTSVVVAKSTGAAALADDLDRGAVYYPGSVLPGQKGQIVILGHSAPPNWPHIKHDWVFSDIENLTTGDTILFNFNAKEYMYRVTQKNIIAQGQDINPYDLSKNNSILTLVSCWPPGKNYKRIAVTAVLET